MPGAWKSPWVKPRPTVLIIDDDHQVVSLIETYLTAAGYSSATAFDPVLGFMIARRDRPKVILLDIAMPAGGGMQLLERLVKTGATRRIPVIVITALQGAELAIEARTKGAVDFLRKPLERETLLAAIGTALSR